MGSITILSLLSEGSNDEFLFEKREGIHMNRWKEATHGREFLGGWFLDLKMSQK